MISLKTKKGDKADECTKSRRYKRYCIEAGSNQKVFDRKREGNLLPQEQIDFQNFIDNANLRIERRSRFMVAMLKIASGMKYDGKSDYVYHGEYQEEWKDWNAAGIYKEFVEKVFMKEEVYAGYEAVIDRLREEADKVVQEDSERKWIDSIMDDLKDLY